jgi:hypothetical protein
MSNEPQLEFLYEASVSLDPPIAIGENPHGNRQILPMTGGSFEGPRLKGAVLAGGADWQVIRPDGVGDLDTRATFQTDDGALIYVTFRGYCTKIVELLPRWAAGKRIPPEEHYFMITPYFETSAAQYAWLQQVVAIGRGSLIPGGVSFRVFTVR